METSVTRVVDSNRALYNPNVACDIEGLSFSVDNMRLCVQRNNICLLFKDLQYQVVPDACTFAARTQSISGVHSVI